MSKAKPGKEKETDEVKRESQAAEQETSAQPPAAQQQAPQPQAMQLDETKTITAYANFARVTGTPEEVIFDFGLNPDPYATAGKPVEISQRIIVNFYTAKRLLSALQVTLERHEGAFGVLETDVQRRVQR
jgi:hypothetical protein